MNHNKDTYLRISLNFKMVVAKMTFHPELINRCCVIVADLALLSIVSYTHSNVIVASITPNVVWHFKPEFEQLKTDIESPIPTAPKETK